MREIRDVDIVIVDEAHRLYTESLEKVERWVKRAKTICLFSYDAGQTLSASENRRRTADAIDVLCENNIYKLTNKIRTNKELALFITCLRDLSKYIDNYTFPHVKIIYEPDKEAALLRAKGLEKEGYTYISFTPSFYNHELDYQQSEYNTHNVIGQEFDGVCMLLDYNWRYENGRLKGLVHPNPDYLFTKLLYQGLTRVRRKLALVVCSESVLEGILLLSALRLLICERKLSSACAGSISFPIPKSITLTVPDLSIIIFPSRIGLNVILLSDKIKLYRQGVYRLKEVAEN